GQILFRIDFDQSVFGDPPSFPFAFDLGNNLAFVNFSGSGAVDVTADVDFTLTLGVSTETDVDFLDRVFLVTDGDDASSLTVGVKANAGYDGDDAGTAPDVPPLNFDASVGPLSLGVSDARALINVTAGGALTPGPQKDGRLTLGEILHPGSGGLK